MRNQKTLCNKRSMSGLAGYLKGLKMSNPDSVACLIDFMHMICRISADLPDAKLPSEYQDVMASMKDAGRLLARRSCSFGLSL